MNRKSLILVALLALALVVLAACANQPPAAPQQQAGETPTVVLAPTELPEPTEPPTPEETSVQPIEPTKETGETDAVVAAEQPLEPQWTVWVANGLDDSLSVIDLASGIELTRAPTGINPHILAASPDGDIIYVINAGQHDRDPNAHADANADATSSHDATEGGDMTTMDDVDQDEDMDAMSDDTMNISAGHENDMDANSLWAFDASSGNVLARVLVGSGPTHPIPSADGRRVYVTNTDEGSVTVIDTDTWEVLTTIPNLAEPHDGELTPDSKWLYLATSADSTMTMVNTDTFEVEKRVTVGTKPRGLVTGGGQGELVYITNKGDGTLSKIDAPSGEVIYTAQIGAGAHAVRLNLDGSLAYVALSKADAVAIVDTATGDVLDTIGVGKTPEQLDLSANGAWLLVSNNGDATISVINLAQEAVMRTVPVGQGAYGIQATQMRLAPAVSSLPDLVPNPDGFVDIEVQQLQDALNQKNFTLVNVHVPYAGEIPETDIFIPFDQIQDQLDALPSQDAPIVVYCRSGSMSTLAATVLAGLGYSNVYELDGGFNAWQSAGNELIVN